MGPAFTAGIVQQLGVTATAALVGRFEGRLTGDLVQHFGPGGVRTEFSWWCVQVHDDCRVLTG